MPSAGMQISPDQGQFMGFLARAIGAQRYLEIGVFTGYSSLAMALAMGPEGRVVALDVSEVFTAKARAAWEAAGVAQQIDLRLAPALESLQAMERAGEAPFDLAFIDADKPNYPHYYEHCLRRVRKGGLILIDNVLWSGQVADPAADDADTQMFREFNAARHADERIDLTLLPIGDGVTMCRVR